MKYFTLSLFLYFFRANSSPIYTTNASSTLSPFSREMLKIERDLLLQNNKTAALMTMLAHERLEWRECNKIIGALEKERDDAIAEVKKIIIPLNVCSFGTIIETLFLDIMTDNTTTIPKDTPERSTNLILRQLRWRKIITAGLERDNDYVKLLVDELDTNFKRENNFTTIDKKSEKYEDYVSKFCWSIVRAINLVNKINALAADGVGRLDSTIFGNIVDKYMEMFYNAMVGSRKGKSDVECT